MQLIRIPKASENLQAATVGQWLKEEGDEVSAGEKVVEILTDKADFALEAEEAGVLRRRAAEEKSTVPVGYIVAVIADPAEDLPDIDAENESLMQEATAEVEVAPARKATAARKPRTAGKKVPATPAARRLAKEHEVDLADVAAALGKKGVLSADDVEEYLSRRG